jgi:hypothetical protein
LAFDSRKVEPFRRGTARPGHRRGLPGWRLDPERYPITGGGKQELSSPGDLERRPLSVAEVECPLQPRRLARPLGAEEVERRVGRDDCPSLAAEQVTGVLGGEDQRSVVLAHAARERDHEPTDRRVLEQQAELVDDQHPPAIAVLDPHPERLREQVVHRRDQLGPQLAHAKDDQRRLEIDARGPAEDLTEAAMHPAGEHHTDAGRRVQGRRHVTEQGIPDVLERAPDGGFEDRPLGLVEAATDDGAEIDGVGDGRSQHRLVGGLAAHVQDVERVT